MSQLDSVEETIGEKKFEIFKLDPLASLAAINVVKEAIAPALGSALGAVESIADVGQILDDPEAGGKLGPAIQNLLIGADLDRQKFLIETFRAVTRVDGKELDKANFSLVFRGDLPLMFGWLKLCFRSEWGNVGRALASGISGAIAQVGSEPTSQDT